MSQSPNPRNLRTPYTLAALAALVFLYAAWTARDAGGPAAAAAASGRVAIDTADAGGSDTLSAPRPRFSLMLFRFN